MTFSDGTVTAPLHFEVVDVFEVRAPLDAATTMTLANPQFGEGGGILALIPDLDRAVESGQLVWIREHRFAPSTLDSRIEDPLFRWVDPDLPARALDPADQQFRGHVEGAAKEASSSARQA